MEMKFKQCDLGIADKYREHIFVDDGCVTSNTRSKHYDTDRRCTGYIYFIQGSCGGAIKIGFTTDAEKRLKTLQTGYPDTLKILLLIPGNGYTEKYLHRKLISCKLKGEWFKPENPVIDQIKDFKEKYPQYKSHPYSEPKF